MDKNRDLWWEAREKTRKQSPLRLLNLVKTFSMSLRGRATLQSFTALNFGATNATIVVDLNLYRPDRDLQKFIDAGVERFILRMGGPWQWVMGDFRYTMDKTFRPYMDQAAKLGIVDLCAGYYIHNAFEDWRLQGVTSNVHLGTINQWTSGGYMPTTSIICDHEVGHCYNSVGAKINITDFNLINSLDSVTAQVYKQWRKASPIYSAAWFMDQWKASHQTFFSNINKPESQGGPGEQRPLWMAWYPQSYTKEYMVWEQAIEELLIPSAEQQQKLLSYGNWTTAKLWQFTSTMKLPGDATGVDCSVSLCSKADLDQAFGFRGTTIPPVEPPTEPPVEDTKLAGRVTALETSLAQLRTNLHNV